MRSIFLAAAFLVVGCGDDSGGLDAQFPAIDAAPGDTTEGGADASGADAEPYYCESTDNGCACSIVAADDLDECSVASIAGYLEGGYCCTGMASGSPYCSCEKTACRTDGTSCACARASVVADLGSLVDSCDGAHCCLSTGTCFCGPSACYSGETEVTACTKESVAFCVSDTTLTDKCVADVGPCTDAWIPLLTNAGFEGGATGWTETSGGGYDIIVTASSVGLPAQAGSYMAWLGGYANALDGLRQAVTIPADALELRLSGWICIASQEAAGADPLDVADVGLTDGAGSVVDHFGSALFWVNGDATGTTSCTWTAFMGAGESVHAGQSLGFGLAATNNATNATNFFFDSLLLEARVCR